MRASSSHSAPPASVAPPRRWTRRSAATSAAAFAAPTHALRREHRVERLDVRLDRRLRSCWCSRPRAVNRPSRRGSGADAGGAMTTVTRPSADGPRPQRMDVVAEEPRVAAVEQVGQRPVDRPVQRVDRPVALRGRLPVVAPAADHDGGAAVGVASPTSPSSARGGRRSRRGPLRGRRGHGGRREVALVAPLAPPRSPSRSRTRASRRAPARTPR